MIPRTANAAYRPLVSAGLGTGIGHRCIILIMAVSLALGLGGPAGANDTEAYKTAGGLGVYFGIIPAAIVKGRTPGDPEATMHGGPPSGPHAYHIIAIFDEATSARVEDATVTAVVSGLGHVGRTPLVLEPMSIAGTITYGGFVNLTTGDRYDIGVDIRVPGRPDPVQVMFVNEHVP